MVSTSTLINSKLIGGRFGESNGVTDCNGSGDDCGVGEHGLELVVQKVNVPTNLQQFVSDHSRNVTVCQVDVKPNQVETISGNHFAKFCLLKPLALPPVFISHESIHRLDGQSGRRLPVASSAQNQVDMTYSRLLTDIIFVNRMQIL